VTKFHLVLLIHAHQPVGNFETVLEGAYQQSYLPFLDLLERHPGVRIGLHYSGPLLEWIERAHPEFIERLRGMARREQLEMIGGGFYEPILVAIPPQDRAEQLRRMMDHLEEQFGRRPAGVWLAERVWEPLLPTVLEAAGVRYTLVDDNHFIGAGFEPASLFGYYLAEDCGAKVRLIPGLKSLRYLIPYQSVEEVIQHLRECAAQAPGGMAAMGDDCEKFGVWPRTFDHCYTDGWLESFFTALEAQSEWLETATPSAALAARDALGRAELPTASYSEMGEWALPTEARKRFHRVAEEFFSRADVQPFLRGGFWRNFLTKYSEVNLLHKKMLHVSAKLHRIESRRSVQPDGLEKMKTLLLRAQCNDAYWHGVFGGIYAPHLRTALLQSLVQAESLADRALHRKPEFSQAQDLDYDADGRQELLFTSHRYAALLKPSDGGTLASLDCRASGVTLINSMTRRPEAYHERMAHVTSHTGDSAVSIHNQTRSKEFGLEKLLKYDRWLRHAFRLLVFPAEQGIEEYSALRLDAHEGLAAGGYELARHSSRRAKLEFCSVDGLQTEKSFSFVRAGEGFEIHCGISLHASPQTPLHAHAGLELVLNLLAPDEENRYFLCDGRRHRLNWAGALPGPQIEMVDEWQGVAIRIHAPAAREFWIAPIETVSESEEGFERVYQGSQILPVWVLDLPPGGVWRQSVTLTVTPRPLAIAV
jgi:4-alpha-glucanotransferase